jgi:hypothetical protein
LLLVSIEEKRNVYALLVGKPEGKILRCRCVNNIKMDLRHIVWSGVDWIEVAQA